MIDPRIPCLYYCGVADKARLAAIVISLNERVHRGCCFRCIRHCLPGLQFILSLVTL